MRSLDLQLALFILLLLLLATALIAVFVTRHVAAVMKALQRDGLVAPEGE